MLVLYYVLFFVNKIKDKLFILGIFFVKVDSFCCYGKKFNFIEVGSFF